MTWFKLNIKSYLIWEKSTTSTSTQTEYCKACGYLVLEEKCSCWDYD